MAYEFSFLSYLANYTARGDLFCIKGHLKDLIKYNKGRGYEVCFSRIFSCNPWEVKMSKEVENNYYTTPLSVRYCVRALKYNDARKDNIDSNVFMPKEQIDRFLSYGTRIVPFEYTILEYKNHYSFIIKLEKQPIFCHKFVLTWVRYLYEAPYIFPAYHLDYYVKKFPKISPVVLYHILLACYEDYGTGHSMGYRDGFPRPITDEELIERVKEKAFISGSRLNGICTTDGEVANWPNMERPTTLQEFMNNQKKDRTIYTKVIKELIKNNK